MDFHLLYPFSAALVGRRRKIFQSKKFPTYGKVWYNGIRKSEAGKAGKI